MEELTMRIGLLFALLLMTAACTAQCPASGCGKPTTYSVKLEWTPPESTPDPIVGYNVYVADAVNGLYLRLNSQPVTTQAYVDPVPAGAVIRAYEVKSADAYGLESAPSNVFEGFFPQTTQQSSSPRHRRRRN